MATALTLDMPFLFLDAGSVPSHETILSGPSPSPPGSAHENGTAEWRGPYGTPVTEWDGATYGADPVDGQDDTDYDETPSTEGSFTQGSGYIDSEVITLSDGTQVTVVSHTGGAIDEFTVDSSGSTGAVVSDTLTQSSTTGSGVGFSLTLDIDNVAGYKGEVIPNESWLLDSVVPDGWYTVIVRKDDQ